MLGLRSRVDTGRGIKHNFNIRVYRRRYLCSYPRPNMLSCSDRCYSSSGLKPMAHHLPVLQLEGGNTPVFSKEITKESRLLHILFLHVFNVNVRVFQVWLTSCGD